jgi:hypothetical protein
MRIAASPGDLSLMTQDSVKFGPPSEKTTRTAAAYENFFIFFRVNP